MSASPTPPLHVFRGILRLIKSPAAPRPLSGESARGAAAAAQSPTASNESAPPAKQSSLRRRVISHYKQNIFLPPREARVQRNLAHDYWILKKDLAERARLHELDAGAEEKLTPMELSRRAAARAGLQLPKLDASSED
ncbi:hypothetical protein THAOC_04037 [Thalassiosira oceanica]|uniref:Uncharacterized protein n=1 Tax=Thalassiosira oceanica TaxID=159749 RepID=K0TB08_THAOC|nr:hypothetical protein THAOC_04037 [Thalassiosira oceanica]|eukprot:EJK74289.1 hypothetical protein THAOC_04037 [Thalassiosira oceanica]